VTNVNFDRLVQFPMVPIVPSTQTGVIWGSGWPYLFHSRVKPPCKGCSCGESTWGGQLSIAKVNVMVKEVGDCC
jgi:hypothetical protein